MSKYGYDLNTGEEIIDARNKMVHVGLGYYVPARSITKEDIVRRELFLYSIDSELQLFKMGLEES